MIPNELKVFFTLLVISIILICGLNSFGLLDKSGSPKQHNTTTVNILSIKITVSSTPQFSDYEEYWNLSAFPNLWDLSNWGIVHCSFISPDENWTTVTMAKGLYRGQTFTDIILIHYDLENLVQYGNHGIHSLHKEVLINTVGSITVVRALDFANLAYAINFYNGTYHLSNGMLNDAGRFTTSYPFTSISDPNYTTTITEIHEIEYHSDVAVIYKFIGCD